MQSIGIKPLLVVLPHQLKLELINTCMNLFDSRPQLIPGTSIPIDPIIADQYFLPRNIVDSIKIELTGLTKFVFSINGANWDLLSDMHTINFNIENLAPSTNMNILFWSSHWENGPPIGEIVNLKYLNNAFVFDNVGTVWLNIWYTGTSPGVLITKTLVETPV